MQDHPKIRGGFMLEGPRRQPGADRVATGQGGSPFSFEMVRSAGCRAPLRAQCACPRDGQDTGFRRELNIKVPGLPNTGLDLFVIQVPNAPFGLAWYLGDLNPDSGSITKTFISRLNEETLPWR